MYLLLVLGVTVGAAALLGGLGRSAGGGRKRRPPGPRPWPIVGNLALLARASDPFRALDSLARLYGNVFSFTFGTVPAVVVTSLPLIKEVLLHKGSHFGGRPDFLRYHVLFGGDRNNSMALCDWSVLQKKRRCVARVYCSPRFTTPNYELLSKVGADETKEFLNALPKKLLLGKPSDLKPLLLAACGNMFTRYMCSVRFSYDDPEFVKVIRYFDEIFWDINQGYALDFLPWLQPMYKQHMKKLSHWAEVIREFIMQRIIHEHRTTLDPNAPPKDFTDALLHLLEEDPEFDWEHIIFELEDFIGGHSAIGNLAMHIILSVIKHPDVGKKIQEEVDKVVGERGVTLFDRANMPYTEAVILETLRTASSPIVPHVATQDTSISGYEIEKGTVVFLNNYDLNKGESYWDNPAAFKPERFLSVTGQISKPEHFIPFSTGKRTCIGQRLVQTFCFILVASLLQNYNLTSLDIEGINNLHACLALPPETFKVILTPRENFH